MPRRNAKGKQRPKERGEPAGLVVRPSRDYRGRLDGMTESPLRRHAGAFDPAGMGPTEPRGFTQPDRTRVSDRRGLFQPKDAA
jgi:hypothetical protein